MAEYIEREAAMNYLDEKLLAKMPSTFANGIWSAHNAVRDFTAVDVAPVRHARWVWNEESEDGYKHHMCSECETDAPFHYTFADYYDEGLDGEWFYVGQRDNGIVEHMDNYCPNCGAKMDLEVSE